MAQPFNCLCGAPSCRGVISGAKDMSPDQLEGAWLNGHIHQLLDLHNQKKQARLNSSIDSTAQTLQDALTQAEKVVEAARLALRTYAAGQQQQGGASKSVNGGVKDAFVTSQPINQPEGLNRHGPTSRELSGEMGGDTVTV